jgi:hypothetical protein
MKIISLLCVVASTATASKVSYLLCSPSSLVVDLRGGATRKSAAVPNLQKGPLAGLRQKLPNAPASAKKEQQISAVSNGVQKFVIIASVLNLLTFLTLLSVDGYYRIFGICFALAISISLPQVIHFPMKQKHREIVIVVLTASYCLLAGFLIGLQVAMMLVESTLSKNDATARGQCYRLCGRL